MSEPDRRRSTGASLEQLWHRRRRRMAQFDVGAATGGPGLARAAAAIAVGCLTLAALSAGGSLDGSQSALVDMGFDPDRAALIMALVAGLLAGGLAALAAGRRLVPGIAGFGVATFLYAPVFVTETRNAIAAPADQGVFTLGGWIVTLVTLLTAGVVVGWAGPTLAVDLRVSLLKAGRAAAAFMGGRGTRARYAVWRPIGAVAVVAALVVALPAFGSLVNYTPDTLMLSGHGNAVSNATGGGLVAGAGTAAPGGTLGSPGSTATHGPGSSSALLASRPWDTARASGSSRIVQLQLPAPWSVGPKTTTVWVYLPAGYDASPALHYDTMYVPLWGLQSWQNGIQFTTMLDALIGSGRIPPTIVVFTTSQFGPWIDSECINSYDGREWFETFIVDTVVPRIDTSYRTIPTPSARTLMGFSQGGWCAAMLTMRHPDVFHNALVFSGYFHSAPRSGGTTNAWRVFGGGLALENAYSPTLNAAKIPADVASQISVILVGNESSAFYGPETTQFAALLSTNGFNVRTLNTSEGHSWLEVRHMMPTALDVLFTGMVRAGVYRNVYS